MRCGWFLVAFAACRSASTPPLNKAGDDRDDGAGLLARASVQLVLGSGAPAALDDTRRHRHPDDDAFGGTSYANWTPPPWTFANVQRPARYGVTATGLDGSINGTVTWTGAIPPRSACGFGLRVGPDRAVRGALVYIEHVAIGRAFPAYARPVAVGGTLAKHGCAFGPVAQIMAPLPAAIAIQGDDVATQLRVTPPAAGEVATVELQAGAVIDLAIAAGVTKIESIDGALGPAYVIGLETPYSSVTDDDGRFRIEDLAPGAYDLTIFEAPIAAGGAPIVTHRTVHVGATAPTKLSIAIGR